MLLAKIRLGEKGTQIACDDARTVPVLVGCVCTQPKPTTSSFVPFPTSPPQSPHPRFETLPTEPHAAQLCFSTALICSVTTIRALLRPEPLQPARSCSTCTQQPSRYPVAMAVLSRIRRRISSLRRHRPADGSTEQLPTDNGQQTVHAPPAQNGVRSERVRNVSAPPAANKPAATTTNTPKQAINEQPIPTNGSAQQPTAPSSQNGSKSLLGLKKKPAPELDADPTRTRPTTGVFDQSLYNPADRSLTGPKPELQSWYPPIEPYDSGLLPVSKLHSLYWEWSGNPQGIPALIVHGGPGAGCSPNDRRWFDPAHYRVLCLDQRGAGRSVPLGETRENTTGLLVEDLDVVRRHFQVERWVVFGHSWGSTLALTYAQAHPNAVSALILAGVFTARPTEAAYLLGGKGTAHIFPELWDAFISFIPPVERNDLITAYHTRLNSSDPQVRAQAAYYWSTYEQAASDMYVNPHVVSTPPTSVSESDLAVAQIEVHYFAHGCFVVPGQLLDPSALDKIRHIPAQIVQGRYDQICPPSTAWEVHRLWPEAGFTLVPDAGHAIAHPGMIAALIEATELCKGLNPPTKGFSARSRGPSSHAHAHAAAHGSLPSLRVESPIPNGSASLASSEALRASSASYSEGIQPGSTVRYSPLRVTGEPAYKRASMSAHSFHAGSVRRVPLPGSAPPPSINANHAKRLFK